jgi:hypothetical protein
MKKELNPEAVELIARFGGAAKIAVLCEITVGAVSQWRHNGIPKAQLNFLKLKRPDLFGNDRRGKRRTRTT